MVRVLGGDGEHDGEAEDDGEGDQHGVGQRCESAVVSPGRRRSIRYQATAAAR